MSRRRNPLSHVGVRCQGCGKTFTRAVWYLRTLSPERSTGPFCSRTCYRTRDKARARLILYHFQHFDQWGRARILRRLERALERGRA